MSLVFLYVVCNKHFYKPAKNQTTSRNFPEIMAKKRSRGHPSQGARYAIHFVFMKQDLDKPKLRLHF